jgi:hypothetical protein
MMGDQQQMALPWTTQHRDMWRGYKVTGPPETFVREKFKEEVNFDILELYSKLVNDGVFSMQKKSRRIDLVGKEMQYWARWTKQETFSLCAFVFHELHPSQVQLCFWDTKDSFPDVKEYIDKRFLIIVVGAGKGEFYHHVLDSKRKEWEVFDPNEFATWNTHTQIVTVLKEELPRSFLNFRIVLNNSAKSNIYWRQGSWVSAPATVVKFVETLIRISWCHHVVFQGPRALERLTTFHWNKLGNITCDYDRLLEKQDTSFVWDLRLLTNTKNNTNNNDEVIFEYVTGKLIDSYLSHGCISVRTYAFVLGNDPRLE